MRAQASEREGLIFRFVVTGHKFIGVIDVAGAVSVEVGIDVCVAACAIKCAMQLHKSTQQQAHIICYYNKNKHKKQQI